MLHGEFTADDIVDYLNQELPGFEPSIIRDSNTRMVTLRVRGRLTFGGYADIPNEHLYVPLHEQSYHLRQDIEEFIRRTRRDLIEKLGLQKEIDAEVKRTVERERKDIEAKAHKKAYEEALATVARSVTPSLDAMRVFLEGERNDDSQH